MRACVRACVRARAFVCILVWFLVPQCRKLNVNVAYGYDEIDHYCNNKTMSDRYYKSRHGLTVLDSTLSIGRVVLAVLLL